ncbi:MAG: IS3 family transposase, partial [Bacteroidales bacterium]|nr:IS3 family transposase [Bacteroidales bacterium]
MKSELLYLSSFKTIDEFEKELKKYITYYNRQRIKTRLKMSPVQFREQHQNKL